MKKFAMIFILSLAVPGQTHAEGLSGKRVFTQYFFPSTSAPYAQPSYTIVDGRTITSISRHFNILYNNDSVEISFLTASTWASDSFNGFKIWDVDGTIDNFGASIASSNMAGLSNSNIRFDNNTVWVNWQGLSFNTGTKIKLNLFSSAVPEPETWALMLTGLALTGASLRRRARSTASRFVVA